MSVKRQATTELNHENWDKDDPADHEDMGTFKPASKEEIGKRVIRTAKRRSHNPIGGDTNKAVFSGFGGFNKAVPSSFDFLANLANGSKPNGNAAQNSEDNVTSGLFSSKPLASSTFQMPVSSPSKVTSSASPPNPLFGGSTNTLFSSSKTDTTSDDSPFHIKSSTLSTATSNPTGFTFKANTATSQTKTPQVSPSLFGSPQSTSNTLFSTNTTNDDKAQKNCASTALPKFGSSMFEAKSPEKKTEKSDDAKDEPNKLKYYSKLKGLNESVLDWIKKHVNETPLCILSPIFKDYEKHLKEIQDEYEKSKEIKKDNITMSKTAGSEAPGSTLFTAKPSVSTAGSLFTTSKTNPLSENKPLSAFSSGSSLFTAAATSSGTANSGFSFGISKPSENTSTFGAKTTDSGSAFGAKVSENISPFAVKSTEGSSLFGAKSSETSSPFAANNKEGSSPFGTKTSASGAAPFSFGTGQPFSFSPNTQNSVKTGNSDNKDENEEDEPPKVEYTPVVEENSVFDKKCKIFVKKGDNYADKGVGTLYLKKLESGKHQLLVRANTNLGNVILNFILSSDIPTQRMGKNNVMLVCIPTPDAPPPPVPTLVRVKTAEEADELLQVLNKHKA